MRKIWKACLKRGFFSIVAIKKTVIIIFLQKVKCKPWLKIFLINETNRHHSQIYLMGPKRDINYSVENDFLHFPYHVQ